MANEAYDVGYSKPPKEYQFMKGVSGNPKGRPRGSRTMASMLSEIANDPCTITEGGRTRTVSLKEAALRQLATGAAKGDRHARRDFFNLLAINEAREEEQQVDEPHERDRAVFDSVLTRLGKAAKNDTSEEVGGTSPTDSEQK